MKNIYTISAIVIIILMTSHTMATEEKDINIQQQINESDTMAVPNPVPGNILSGDYLRIRINNIHS